MWSKAKTGGKAGFDKVYGWVDKLGAPVNRLSNKVGAEAFWPTTLDKESDKAARILRSFCSMYNVPHFCVTGLICARRGWLLSGGGQGYARGDQEEAKGYKEDSY
jgi:hypothetical protein